MKIATWNINSINARIDQVVAWCKKNQPDVLCLQETKCIDSKFPRQQFRSAGFEHIEIHGEKTYNGVAIISKLPLYDIQKNFPGDAADAPRRMIASTVAGLRIVNVYVPHGTEFDSEKFTFKLDWIARLRDYLDKNFSVDDDLVLCGDLNVAPHEMDVWNPSLLKDKMHFSKPERDAIHELKRWGFTDVFRQMNDETDKYSWWSNFHHSFEKNRGMRLDHIWAPPPVAESCIDSWIDQEPRALEKSSDHAPVVADFDL